MWQSRRVIMGNMDSTENPASGKPGRSHDALEAFRHRNFRLFTAARFLIISGIEMQSLAVGWQIYSITRRPLDLGLVGLAQFLPGLMLFWLGGHVADRFERRNVLLCCEAGFALCSLALLAITLRGVHGVGPIYCVLVGIGLIRVFNGPAGQAFIPLLVPAEIFPVASAWGSGVFNTATITGPLIGGLLYAAAGSPVPVYITAACALVLSAGLVGSMRVRGLQKSKRGATEVLAGFRYVLKNRLILGSISLDLFAVLLGGAVALLPVYAREILMAGPRGLGMLRASPALGATLMALTLANRPLRRHAGAKMMACVAAFGVCTIVFGLSRNLYLSMAALFLVGASDMVSVVMRSTLVQLATPDEMRGRVSAVNLLFIGTSNEFGQFESGVTAQWWGAVPAVVVGGVGTLLVVGLWSIIFPALRRVDELTPESLRAARVVPVAEQTMTDAQ
jgi:MFS family permease